MRAVWGDISVQVKGTLFRTERAAVAFGTSLRLPTGDAYNALHFGAAGIRPFVAASVIYKKFSPHVNLGYLFNGRSVLAADNILSGQKGRIPSQVQYAAGVDAGVTQRLTVAFDILGFEAIHAGRVHANSLQPFTRESFNVINGAAGFKARLFGNVIFQANLLFRLEIMRGFVARWYRWLASPTTSENSTKSQIGGPDWQGPGLFCRFVACRSANASLDSDIS